MDRGDLRSDVGGLSRRDGRDSRCACVLLFHSIAGGGKGRPLDYSSAVAVVPVLSASMEHLLLSVAALFLVLTTSSALPWVLPGFLKFERKFYRSPLCFTRSWLST